MCIRIATISTIFLYKTGYEEEKVSKNTGLVLKLAL
jgi:hypothetical protein